MKVPKENTSPVEARQSDALSDSATNQQKRSQWRNLFQRYPL